MHQDLGAAFANAVAAKDHVRIRALVHPEVDFWAMTPGEIWDASSPDEIVGVLGDWFGDEDLIQAIELLECDGFADRRRVGYRLRVKRPDGEYLIEQQAYLSERDGLIGWLRILCSGYRPSDAGTAHSPTSASDLRQKRSAGESLHSALEFVSDPRH